VEFEGESIELLVSVNPSSVLFYEFSELNVLIPFEETRIDGFSSVVYIDFRPLNLRDVLLIWPLIVNTSSERFQIGDFLRIPICLSPIVVIRVDYIATFTFQISYQILPLDRFDFVLSTRRSLRIISVNLSFAIS
jgi:hypothetical protein